MGNFLGIDGLSLPAMAPDTDPTIGIAHPTVIPANIELDPRWGEEGDEQGNGSPESDAVTPSV